MSAPPLFVQSWFNVHTHSETSSIDGMARPKLMVQTAWDNGEIGFGITDHGNLSSGWDVYRACMELGMAPFIGSELYITMNLDKEALRYHLGVLALTEFGYKGLVRLSTLSHQRDHYHRKPRITFPELIEWGKKYGKHVAITSGCYFGLIIQALIKQGENAAKAYLGKIASVFPHTFVEIQHHNTDHKAPKDWPEGQVYDHTDASLAEDLYCIAYDTSLPVIVTNDSHYCNTREAPVWMADMSFRQLGDVEVGDEVVGWRWVNGRRCLVSSAVEDKTTRTAPVVKITMASGRVVRCTRSHRWASQRNMRYASYTDEYVRAEVGDPLMSLVEPKDYPETGDGRWLGGMYDGEGSGVSIAQSLSHNPDVCAEIERTMKQCGIVYSIKDNGSGCSLYTINGGRQGYIDFLNIAQPIRSRGLVSRILGGQLKSTPDEVVSIDSDGVDEVVSLTTSTGNYTAWGYASKNCDEADKASHDLMKRLVMYSGDDDDVIFPGDSYHIADGAWVYDHFVQDGIEYIADDAADSYEYLLDHNKLRIPILDKYKFMLPVYTQSPDNHLKRLAEKGLHMLDLDIFDTYERRLRNELEVIAKMGFSDYFNMMAEDIAWGRKQGILIEARGSANGSLVCYALGITSVDPIVWDTSFDRFLSLDRMKPPDIDLDIERDRRDEYIDHVRQQHPGLVGIGTYSTLGEDEQTGRGSLFVKYIAMRKRMEPGWEPPRDYSFAALAEEDPDAAKALRKLGKMRVRTAPGAHAAGYVLNPPAAPIDQYVPTMLIPSSGTTVTQYMMAAIEDAGYVKFDFLGAAALTTIGNVFRLLGEDPLVAYPAIPLEDKDALALLREGKTDTGLFQYEGWQTAKGGKQMRVKTVMDAIFCLALYRPALLKSGNTDEFLYNRAHKKEVTYLSQTFERNLGYTYGVFVFQEQVIAVLRDLGLDPKDLNAMLKAVKASNEYIQGAKETFDRIHPIFVELCKRDGMTGDEPEEAWEMVMDFSDYGFNRAHATGYGLRAYRMAYLKAHHLQEFMAGLLATWAGTKKESPYIREARRVGVRLGKADINGSKASWSIDPNGKGLRRGLSSIPGIGPGAAEEIVRHQPYSKIEDVLDRCSGAPGMVTGGKEWRKNGTLKGVLEALRQAGALESIGVS